MYIQVYMTWQKNRTTKSSFFNNPIRLHLPIKYQKLAVCDVLKLK
jgi:hypothetical protein